MVNAGRVLIIPKGTWSNLVTYEMLDLVTDGDIAYIAKQSSVGQKPSNDTAMTYWQPFGTAAKIATTSEPGLVMPDGTTITIDNTGLISVILGITGLTDVAITSLSNGQILQFDGSTSKWKNVSLGTAAFRNATSTIASGSTDLIESGAVNSLKQTLETDIENVTPVVLTQTLTAGSTTLTFTNDAIGNNSRIRPFSNPFVMGLIEDATQSGTSVTLTCASQSSDVSISIEVYNYS